MGIVQINSLLNKKFQIEKTKTISLVWRYFHR